MIRINPLLVLALSFVIFVVSITSVQKSNLELKSKTDELKQMISIGSDYKKLKQTWDKQDIEKQMKKIARLSSIKNIFFKNNKKSIIITIKNENIRNIDRFLNKILNDSFVINKLNISKESITMEVGK